jgi:hypothetical protein
MPVQYATVEHPRIGPLEPCARYDTRNDKQKLGYEFFKKSGGL